MDLKVDIPPALIISSAVFGIGLVWANFTAKAFKVAWHIITFLLEQECQEHFIDEGDDRSQEPFYDEYMDESEE